MASTDLGSDFACVMDLDPNLTVVSGRLALGQAVARRWLTIPGTLWYDRTYGAGLLAAINGAVQSTESWSSILETEALKDERVLECTVSVSFANETLTVLGRLVDAEGPFDLTVAVGALSIDVLLGG
jgi:hypothetical protein